MEKNRDETRKERFRRVATRRTNNILRQIQILGNCSNKSSYSYTEEDIRKIFSAIETELRSVKAKFVNKRKNNFQL
ncbi:MAG: hypothetical protein J7M30_11700 [Deltaproteobacteria bacterium]|nr:hypothetical protein [Deltaproteobacteria bacterium]